MQHNFLQYGGVACITFAVVITHSAALRPSEHGLANQRDASSPAAHQNGDANKTLSSFFASATPSVPLPEAQSIGGEGGGGGDTWRSARVGGGSRDLRKDHVRLGLLAAAAICGFAGVVLLVVSGVVYHLRRRREKAGVERFSSY